MTSHDPTTTYQRQPAVHAVEMDGELVMMGQEQGEYVALREVAASIWRLLEEPRTLDDLVDAVCHEYQVAVEDCRPDVVAFLDDLRVRRLVSAS